MVSMIDQKGTRPPPEFYKVKHLSIDSDPDDLYHEKNDSTSDLSRNSSPVPIIDDSPRASPRQKDGQERKIDSPQPALKRNKSGPIREHGNPSTAVTKSTPGVTKDILRYTFPGNIRLLDANQSVTSTEGRRKQVIRSMISIWGWSSRTDIKTCCQGMSDGGEDGRSLTQFFYLLVPLLELFQIRPQYKQRPCFCEPQTIARER